MLQLFLGNFEFHFFSKISIHVNFIHFLQSVCSIFLKEKQIIGVAEVPEREQKSDIFRALG